MHYPFAAMIVSQSCVLSSYIDDVTPQVLPPMTSTDGPLSQQAADSQLNLPTDNVTPQVLPMTCTDGPLSQQATDSQLNLSISLPFCQPPLDISMDADPLIPGDYSLKMKEGYMVRNYQLELAAPGMRGENYILVAPTGSGKTVVSALVISDHLQKHQHQSPFHVVFVVNTKPLADQQRKKLDELIPAAKVDVYTGDNPGRTIADSIQNHNHISVCTAGKLLGEIQGGYLFNKISLMVFDECHHAQKGHPYAGLMGYYLDHLDRGNSHLPQVIGMTASPGAGDNPDLDRTKTINHLVDLAATLDAIGGFKTVTENVEELQRNTKNSSFTCKILKPRDTTNDPFIILVVKEMAKLEEGIPKMKACSLNRWSQEYETKVQQLKKELESSIGNVVRDDISTLNLLRCYGNALNIYMDLQQKDAIEVVEMFTDFPEDDTKATLHERMMKEEMKVLLKQLKQFTPKSNPLLENLKETLCDTYLVKPTSKAIIFVRTKKHASAMHDWLNENPVLHRLIQSDVMIGHKNETVQGMTQLAQKEVMSKFNAGDINLLLATSVADEGLDVPECNLVIRYQHASNEIAKVQTEGRARAENSQGITILSSDSKVRYRELKNRELVLLVDDILDKRQIPTGPHLQKQLKKLQQDFILSRKMKADSREKQKRRNKSDNIQLLCRKCRIFACLGSDIYTFGSHHVVPDQDFQTKITCRPHSRKGPLEGTGTPEVQKTHKIYCAACEHDWGVKCTWPTDGHTFPVIKCTGFALEIEGAVLLMKKWSAASFNIEPLSDWINKKKFGESDSYDSS